MAGPWERYWAAAENGPWTKYQPAPEPAKPEAEAWNPALGAARSAVDGIPIVGPLYTGAVDHISSAIAGAITGEDPAAMRDRVNARQEAFQQEQPIVDAVARIGGGMVGVAPLAATKAGATALGMAGSNLQRIGMGAASGGAISGTDTLVRGGSAQDALLNAGLGFGLGAGAGAIAPLAGKGAEAVKSIMQQGQSSVPGSELSDSARRILIRALDAGGALGEGGIQNVAAAGKGGMLADASPSAAGLLDTVIQRGGPGSKAALEAVESRASQVNQDITEALDAALGKPQGVHTVETGLRTGTASVRDAAYKAAYASPIDYAGPAGRAIEGLVQRVPGDIIAKANRMMSLEGHQSSQIMAQIAEDGTVTYMRMPDVMQLDYITRALNTAAKSGDGQGALGGQTDIGRLYGNLSRQIRDVTKEAVPAYAEALETAAKPIQAREALQFGNGVLSPSVARDDALETIAAMTTPERDAAKQGLRSYVDEVLANVRAVASDPNIDAREARKALQDLSSRAAREKLGALIGDEAATSALFAQLDEAGAALGLRASVAQNSKTYARLAMDQVLSDEFESGVVNTALQGKPINALQSAVQSLTGRNALGIQNMKDAVAGELGNALTMPRDRAIDLISGLASLNARGVPVPTYLAGAVAPGANALGSLSGITK